MRHSLIVFCLFIFSCKSPTKKNVALKNIHGSDTVEKIYDPVDPALGSRITDTLIRLSFIREANQRIDSATRHKHGIAFIVDTLANEKDIFVQAGYNGEERFETYYQFYVNPVTMEIRVYDAVNDKKLSVKEFEKANR